MSNLNPETIREKGIDAETLLQGKQTEGLICRLRCLLASQRRNLQNLSALVVFNFIAAGLFFVTQVKIANVIGKEQFGLLSYGIALGMYGQTIVRYGIDRTLVRDLIHYPNRFAELAMASLLLRGVLLVLVVAGLLIWKLVWQSADMSWPVIAIIIAYSLKSLDLQPVYDAWHCMTRHAVYNMVRRGLYFALVWAVIFYTPYRLTLLWISVALLATDIFYLLLQQRWAFQRINFSGIKIHLSGVIRKLAKSNFWIWLATMAGLSFGTLNQIILKYYCGLGELGSYAASWQIVAVAMLLLYQVGRIGNPATARITRPESNGRSRKSFLLKYSFVMAVIALPFVIPSILFPRWILMTIFKPEYASSAAILRLFGIYIMLYSIGIVASQYVVSARMERTYFISVIIGGLLSIIFCLFLIPQYAGLGAAISLLISHGIAIGLYWIALIHHIKYGEHRACEINANDINPLEC